MRAPELSSGCVLQYSTLRRSVRKSAGIRDGCSKAPRAAMPSRSLTTPPSSFLRAPVSRLTFPRASM